MKTVITEGAACLAANVRRLRRGHWEDLQDVVAREERVRLIHETATRNLWAWPFDLEDLVLGHVLLECLPRHTRHNHDLAPFKQADSQCHPCGVLTGTETVPLQGGDVERLPAEDGLHLFQVRLNKEKIPAGDRNIRISATNMVERMQEFLALEGYWGDTGSFHRVGLFCPHSQRFVRLAEDIGRHNCLDRLVGYCARNVLDPAAHILLTTARITGSLYAKARRAGFCCMISRSAVTGASLLTARQERVTLAGFCRPDEDRLTVFEDAPGRLCEQRIGFCSWTEC
jgi:FdhD protein